MMELLAPAGGYEALTAAVQNGADAVYMGFGAFNARRSAKNFTDEEFASAVRYCHLRGVRVFLTLNTLLTDRELPGAAAALRKASAMGVDAVLVGETLMRAPDRKAEGKAGKDVPAGTGTRHHAVPPGMPCRRGVPAAGRKGGAGLPRRAHAGGGTERRDSPANISGSACGTWAGAGSPLPCPDASCGLPRIR